MTKRKVETIRSDEQPLPEQSASEAFGSTRVDPRLLEMLVCPLTRQSLDYDSRRNELISRGARLVFPIRDGIPVMLPDEARILQD